MSKSPHAVEGYAICPCGAWVRDEVAVRTDGHCPPCFTAAGSKRVTTLELVGRGMVVQIPRNRDTRKRPGRKRSEQTLENKRLGAKAKRAARKRLSAIFVDVYEMLLAEERGALGLEPWPTEIALRGGDITTELGFAELIAELDQRGVSV